MRIFQKLFNRAKQPDGSYKLSSFWTSAKTVEFDDGKTLEEYRVNVDNALDHKGDGLFYDEETNYLYLLSGENRLSGVEITTGGLGEVLGDVSDVEVTPDTTSVTIKWTDPSDGQTVEWGGTTVIRKRGGRPVDCLDGEVVVESTTRNQYRTTGYTDSNLEKNTNYWYRFFPYSTTGQIRTGLAVSTNTLADETIIEEFPSVAGVYTYTGSEQTVTLDDYDENQMVIQSGNTGTDAGVYTVAITPKLGLKWPDNSTDTLYLDWTIRKASINLLPYQVGDITYTGTTRTPSWGNYDENQLIISGDSDGVNAGTYTATFTPTSNYQWADGSVTGKNIQWTIQKANITSAPVQNGSLDYTGETLSPTWINYDSSKLTISGQTSGVDSGEYIAVFTPTANYKWADGTTGGKEAVWTIENKRISAVPSQSGSLTYNGNSQSPTWINYDSEKMTVSGDTGTDAGTYTATFTPKDGYMWNDGTSTSKTARWTINRQSINNYPSQSGTLNYSGSSQSPTWNYYDTSKMTISGSTSGTNAGTYTATFTPKSNYQWTGGSTAARSVSWVINKVNDSMTLSKTSMSFTSSGSTSTATASGYHGTLSVSTSDSSVATASVSGSTITVTCKGSGSATITVTSSATTNYYSVSKSISVSANTVQTIQYVPSQSGTLTYNGSSQSPTWSNYNSSQLTIGGTTSATNAGTYTATFTPKSGYAWSDGTTGAKSVDWVIETPSVVTLQYPFVQGPLRYTGEQQTMYFCNYNYGEDPNSGYADTPDEQRPAFARNYTDMIDVTGSVSRTNAGTAVARFTPKEGYTWSDGTRNTYNVTWEMEPYALPKLSLGNSIYAGQGFPYTGNISWSLGSNLPPLTADDIIWRFTTSSPDARVLSKRIEDGKLYLEFKIESSGTVGYTWYLSSSLGSNYSTQSTSTTTYFWE